MNQPSNDILKQTVSFECPLCLEEYDNEAKYPMIVCTNQHTYCLCCINTIMFKTGNQSKCPECKLKVLKANMIKNRILNNIKQSTQSSLKKQDKFVQIFQESNVSVQGVIQSNILKLKITTRPTKRTSTDKAEIQIGKLCKDKQPSPRSTKQIAELQMKFKKEVDDLVRKLASQESEYIKQIAKLCDENDKIKATIKQQDSSKNNTSINVIKKQNINISKDGTKQKPMPAPSYKPAIKQQQLAMINNSRSQFNLLSNPTKISQQFSSSMTKIRSNPIKSIIWVDTKCQQQKKVVLNNNLITCTYPHGTNVFGSLSLISANEVYQVTIGVTKMIKYMGVGITDSKYCGGGSGKCWMYYGNGRYCWDGLQGQGKYEGSGFKQGDVVAMSVNLRYKTIQWRVNGQLECTSVISQEESKVAWVPYINLTNEGDTVSLYE